MLYCIVFLIILSILMDSLDSTNGIKIKDIAQNQYKLYDVQLFKSQLKIFQKQANNQQSHTMRIQDQSLHQDQFFPITHQDVKQQHNIFSINHSFQMESQQPSNNNIVTEPKQKEKPVNDQQLVVQTWKNRPRRVSNPMFLQNKNQQSNQLVKQLETLSKQRTKYQQTNYFSKKQRSVQVKSIQDIFQTYKQNQEPFNKPIIVDTPKSNTLDEFLIPKSPLSVPSPISNKPFERPKLNDNECQLCQLTKSKVEKLKFFKSNNNRIMTPQLAKHQQQIQKEEISTEPRIRKINLSPSKSPANKYLAMEDKNKYKSELTKELFKNQVPLKEEYIQSNRLRDEYLRNAKMRSEQIHFQIQKLKHPVMLQNRKSSSRKSIFALNTPKTIKSQLPKKAVQPTTPQHTIQGKSPYKNIFKSNIEKNNKKQNQSVDFKYVRESLVNTRIHIFNTKSRQKEAKESEQKPKSKRKISIFKKQDKKHSPLKNQIIFNFNLLQMDYQTRQWFQRYQKDIILQAQKIYSYQLINRYISKGQIEVRLRQFVTGRIEPKRWVLLMVDSVYARLKDRYLPN